MPYRIVYVPEARQHLRALTARQRSMVFDQVDAQLIDVPEVETKNRKRLRPNPVAPWELRIGALRVYYDVRDPEVVFILAVGMKRGNRVFIAG